MIVKVATGLNSEGNNGATELTYQTFSCTIQNL